MNTKKHLIFLLALLFLGAGFAGHSLVSSAEAQDAGLQSLRESGQAFRSVAKKVSPAVVFIQAEKELKGNDGN